MTLKTKDGREVTLSVSGTYKHVEIQDVVYVDTGEDVPDEVVRQLEQDHYPALCEELMDAQIAQADAMEDR